jgi:hypothetical protein
MKKICPLCGTENVKGASFCKECNEPLYDLKLDKEKEKSKEEGEIEWIPGYTEKKNSKDEKSKFPKRGESILKTEDVKKEEFYINKVFKMVEDGMWLINPFGVLSLADKDFLSFELTFFYYFIYDYRMFSQLDRELRVKILNKFFEKIQTSRPQDFKDVKDIDQYYERRIFSYLKIMQGTKKMGDFGVKSANYINTLLTFSEMKNVFTGHTLEQAERELKSQIQPDKYTEELQVLLTISSAPLLINGIDPTEIPK